jgi:sugar phosphate permease
VAGIAALMFEWNAAFVFCGAVMIGTGILFFMSVTIFERRGVVTYQDKKAQERKGGSIKILIENKIIQFSFVSILTGIVRTSVTFWIPTYLSQYLEYSTGVAASIYTAMTCVRSVAPYVGNLIIYERVFKRDMNRSLISAFAVSAMSFALMFVVKSPMLNIVFLCLALMAESVASNLLWSVYCPSLRDTGMVSSATGYLDFLSYAAAGTANLLFANAISTIGWGNLILVWAALMGVGVLISVPLKKYIRILRK